MPLFVKQNPTILVGGSGAETLSSLTNFWMGDHLHRGLTQNEGQRDIRIIGNWTIIGVRMSQRSNTPATGTNAAVTMPVSLKNRSTGALYLSILSFAANTSDLDNQVSSVLSIPVLDGQSISFNFTTPNYVGGAGIAPAGWTCMLNVYMV
jgi:hypothetical protein